MSLFTRRQVEIGIGNEATRGTGVSADFWMPKTSLSFDDKVTKSLVTGSYGHITDAPLTGQVVTKYAEGNIEGELNVNSFGLLLLALVGTVSSSTDTPESGVNTHDYTIQNDVQHDSLTIHQKDPIGSMRFRMAMLNSLEISVSLGEYVTYSANFISKAHQDEAASTSSYSTDYRFVHPDFTFKVASSASGLSGASSVSLKSLTLTIEKNVERLETLGTIEPEDIVNKGIKISGSLELNYEDRTWRDYMLDGTTKAMQIKLESSRTIGSSTSPTLDFQFPKVHFSGWEASGENADITGQSINFEIMYDLANTRLWSTMQLINTQSSY